MGSHLINKTGRGASPCGNTSARAESQKQTKMRKNFVSFVYFCSVCGALRTASPCQTSLHWKLLLAIILSIAFTCTGCRTFDKGMARIINEPAPLPEATRAHFGMVAMLPPGSAQEFGFRHPATPTEAMLPIAATTFNVLKEDAEGDRNLREAAGKIALALLISGTVGVIGGIIVGVPEEELKKCEATMRQAVEEQPLEPAIQSRVQQVAAKARFSGLVSVPASAAAKLDLQSVTNRDFRALANLGFDSLLSVRVSGQWFEEADGFNPALTYGARVEVDVIRVSDGALLHSGHLDYRGHQMRFTEWAANDAKAFRAETERARRAFAWAIMEQLFAIDTRR